MTNKPNGNNDFEGFTKETKESIKGAAKEVKEGLKKGVEYAKFGLGAAKDLLEEFAPLAISGGKELVKGSKKLGGDLAEFLGDGLDILTSIEVLTLEEVSKYFAIERENLNDGRIKKGALQRKKRTNVYVVTFLFLDQDDKIVCDTDGRPYGKYCKAEKLSDELEQMFAEHDLVIFA